MFAIRTTKPTAGNKYFIRDDEGGFNTCVLGSPTDKDCNVLANCVGYAQGRTLEIYKEMTGKTDNPFRMLNCNAENFIERAKSSGLEIVDYPVLGGIMVFQKGSTLSGNDGAGHVLVVEDIYDSNTIFTSESAWKGSAFFNVKRNNNNGRWGMGSNYSFRGCIVNPGVGKVTKREEPKPIEEEQKFKIGDKVIINGSLFKSSIADKPSGQVSNKITVITRYFKGSKHPYNTANDLGWMDENSIFKYEENRDLNKIAKEVIQGKWGNGANRKKRLTEAGFNYSEIQKLANKMMKG